MARGRPVDLVIAPFVFRLRAPAEGAPSHEVGSLHWLSLERLLAPETRSTLEYAHEGTVLELPCLRIDGLVIWGLTYRMFASLASLLEREHKEGSTNACTSLARFLARFHVPPCTWPSIARAARGAAVARRS